MAEFDEAGILINKPGKEFREKQANNIEALKSQVPLFDQFYKDIRGASDLAEADKTAMIVQVKQKNDPRVILAIVTEVNQQQPGEYKNLPNPPKDHVDMQMKGFGVAAVDGSFRRVITDGNGWREIEPRDNIAGTPDNTETLKQMKAVAGQSGVYDYNPLSGEGFLKTANDEYKIQHIIS